MYTAKCHDTYALYFFDILDIFQIHCMVRHLLGWNQYPRLKPFWIYGIKQIYIIFLLLSDFLTSTPHCAVH